MRESVKPAFIHVTESWEGPASINWMFPDIKGLVSTGMGILLEPVALAVGLPWRRSDGSLANRDEIVADFFNVKNHPDAARLGHRSVRAVAKLRIKPEDLHQVVLAKVASNESILRQGFPEFDEWCADAQLAAHSLAWACGPSYWSPKAGRCYFPKLTAALRARDFRAAADECKMDEAGNPGIIPRNRANKVLFLNAAVSHELQLQPEVLYWPTDIASDPPSSEEETQPRLNAVVDFALVHPPVPLGPHGLPMIDNDSDDEPPDAA